MAPPPLSRQPARLAQTGRQRKRDNLLTGEGMGRGGEEPNQTTAKAWPSINNSILAVVPKPKSFFYLYSSRDIHWPDCCNVLWNEDGDITRVHEVKVITATERRSKANIFNILTFLSGVFVYPMCIVNACIILLLQRIYMQWYTVYTGCPSKLISIRNNRNWNRK